MTLISRLALSKPVFSANIIRTYMYREKRNGNSLMSSKYQMTSLYKIKQTCLSHPDSISMNQNKPFTRTKIVAHGFAGCVLLKWTRLQYLGQNGLLSLAKLIWSKIMKKGQENRLNSFKFTMFNTIHKIQKLFERWFLTAHLVKTSHQDTISITLLSLFPFSKLEEHLGRAIKSCLPTRHNCTRWTNWQITAFVAESCEKHKPHAAWVQPAIE